MTLHRPMTSTGVRAKTQKTAKDVIIISKNSYISPPNTYSMYLVDLYSYFFIIITYFAVFGRLSPSFAVFWWPEVVRLVVDCVNKNKNKMKKQSQPQARSRTGRSALQKSSTSPRLCRNDVMRCS